MPPGTPSENPGEIIEGNPQKKRVLKGNPRKSNVTMLVRFFVGILGEHRTNIGLDPGNVYQKPSFFTVCTMKLEEFWGFLGKLSLHPV